MLRSLTSFLEGGLWDVFKAVELLIVGLREGIRGEILGLYKLQTSAPEQVSGFRVFRV